VRAANSMYDFRLASVSLLATVAVAVGAIVGGGELSAAEKSLQFEAAFQGEIRRFSDVLRGYTAVLAGRKLPDRRNGVL